MSTTHISLNLLPTINPNIYKIITPTNTPTPTLIKLTIPSGVLFHTSTPANTVSPTATQTPTSTVPPTESPSSSPTSAIEITDTPTQLIASVSPTVATTAGISPELQVKGIKYSSQFLSIGILLLLVCILLVQQWPKIRKWLHEKTA